MIRTKITKEHPKNIICSDGSIFSIFLGRNMKPAHDKKGYLRTALTDKDGNSKTVKVHRVVAKAFIPNPKELEFVNHKNGIKDDNRVCNLEWVSASENSIHAVQNGLVDRVVLTPSRVRGIRALYSTGKYYQREIAELFGLRRQTISDVITKRRWGHV
jgi:hypothetical protein